MYIDMKKFLTAILLLSMLWQGVSAQERRPIDSQHPMWFIHVDVWYKADPQKIIALIPSDIRPFVCLNLSLSCGYDKDKNRYKMPQYAFQTYKSWATVCQKNGMWFTCQPASGGHTHIQDYDMATFEYFFKKFPNFLGWNYAEQFWGFDEAGDKSSATQTDRWALFGRLVEMSHQYGGLLTVSFCGNVWSHQLNPIAQLKRNKSFMEACQKYPEAILFLYKYTTSSCFYNNESVSFGPFISGLTKNYGVRYDNCGWNGAMDAIFGENSGKKYPSAAGIGTVMEQTCVNGGAVWDGPELTWREECFHEVDRVTVDGYQQRKWSRYDNMNGVWVDMFRKIVDGTMYIPTRAEVVGNTKIVIINDVAGATVGTDVASNQKKYATWDNLYDGIYKLNDPMNRNNGYWMDNFMYLKSTGRYGTIPMVTGLYDDAAQAIPLQIKSSNYSSRWSSIAKKQADYNELYPEVSTGDLFVNRFRNQLVTYNPHSYLNAKQRAEAVVPLQYNTCETMELRYDKLSSAVIREYADHIDFYMNNYRTDTTTFRADTIILQGCTKQPTLKLTKHSSAKSYSQTAAFQTYSAENQSDTIVVKHCGALELTVTCSGTADRSAATDAIEKVALEKPKQPETWRGEILIEAEDMDFKNIASCVTDPYGQYPKVLGHSGNGFMDMGSNTAGALRHKLNLVAGQEGSYVVSVRYTCTSKAGNISIEANGTTKTVKCEKTAENEWRYVSMEATMNTGSNNLVITNTGGLPMYIDQVSYRPADVAPMTYYVSIEETDHGTITADKTEAAEGDTITLTVKPKAGRELQELRVINSIFYTLEKTIPVTDPKRVTFVMPNDNVTIQPVYSDASAIMKLDMSNVLAGTVPPGWRCTQENDEVHVYPTSYTSGGRVFNGFTGYQGKAIYWRNKSVDYGRLTDYPLTLEPGDYTLTFAMAAWKESPKYKVQVLKKSTSTSIATSAVLTASPNANGVSSANLSSARENQLKFTVKEAGDYVVTFSDATTTGGYHEFLLLECRVNSDYVAIMGDANGDMAVDVEDVVAIVNYILNEPADDFIEANADVNGDGKIDVDDVVAVVNIILEDNPSATAPELYHVLLLNGFRF